MIRYPITEAELWRRIETLQPTWRTRTQQRTADLVAAGRYQERSSIWSEIKSVYMDLQHAKCGYCEKWLEHTDYGSIENDIEHYRPKSSVRAYPPTASSATASGTDARANLTYSFSTGDDGPAGYFHLAYHPLNYLTACKTCNTILKSDYFPVAATRVTTGGHPHDYDGEQPFLPYPIGDFDVAPETLIGFEGIFAIPIGTNEAERRRAEVTIDFFQLNNREDLRRQRIAILRALYSVLTALPHYQSEEMQREARQLVDAQTSPAASHSNFSACFVRLFQADQNYAARLAHEASNYSIS